ncbi:MAG: heparinase II/III family protein [Bacteroidales bacterium]|nr:heparinase II/III family protein [Bacteroidales bacterium]
MNLKISAILAASLLLSHSCAPELQPGPQDPSSPGERTEQAALPEWGEPEDINAPLNGDVSLTTLPEWEDISLDYSLLDSVNHPRLIFLKSDFESIPDKAKENTYLGKLHSNIMGAAKIMARISRPLEYSKDEAGKSILQICRKAVHRIADLAYAYRVSGEEVYLRMAEWNINVVCDFPDWNSAHFLDAAEMALAVSLGYDWLKAELSDSTLAKVPLKVREYALEPGLSKKIWRRTGNWNQVCCSGLVCASLALYENYPELADEVIRRCLSANAREVKAIYSPDGAFPEGPGYWEYGTTYEGIMCMAMETALGSDLGIPLIDGFSKAGDFYTFDRGNTGRRFNYADSGESDETSLALWYLAYRQGRPSFLYQDIARLDDDTYLHEYYSFLAAAASLKMGNVRAEAPQGSLYSSDGAIPLMICRTGWNISDPYLALKGGCANASHAHLDVGEIVYEQYGTRWFKDFTYTSNYTELELIFAASGLTRSQLGSTVAGSWRWKVFQYHNRQHSTITVDDKDHCPYGYARVVSLFDSDEQLGGEICLDDPFKDQLAAASRKAVIRSGSYLEVRDSLHALPGKDARIRWTCCSDAKPEIVSSGILLSDGNTTMKLSTDAPGAVFRIWSSDPADYPTPLERGEDPLEGYICGFEFDIPASGKILVTTTLKRNQ